METTDVPFTIERVIETPVNVDIHVEVEKVAEVAVVKETIEEVSLMIIIRLNILQVKF